MVGGAESQDSVRNGLEGCGAANQDVILVHDGVRPFFPQDQIGPLVQLAAVEGAALLAVPAQDTIKEVFDGRVRSTLDRSLLWQAQTPQAFRCERIREAHRRAHASGYVGTDDASLIEWCGWPVAVLPGHPHNIKITTPADLALARALLEGGEVSLA
jgi:2-C-methyl-D-erythritol 4-phosphate cytidylyltransferase